MRQDNDTLPPRQFELKQAGVIDLKRSRKNGREETTLSFSGFLYNFSRRKINRSINPVLASVSAWPWSCPRSRGVA
jgi:hypothetical protein